MNPNTELVRSMLWPRTERKLAHPGSDARQKSRCRGANAPPPTAPGSGFWRRIARLVLLRRILLGQVASSLAKPVGLDVVPHLGERDRVIVADFGHVDGMRGM